MIDVCQLAMLLLASASAALLLLGSVGTATVLVPMSDDAIFFSDYNWIRSGGTAMTANPGAFLRVSFTGASLALLVNGTGLSGQSVKLRYSVDDRSMGFLLPNASADAIVLPVPALSGGRTRHTLELSLYASNEQADRWLGGTYRSAYLVLTGLRLDSGAVLAPPTSVLPRRAIVFGDSISEGTNAQLYDYDRDSCGRSGTLAAAAAPRSWAFGFGEAMQAEVSNCAFAAQGYSTFNSLLYGNIPPLLTLGEPTSTAWDKLDSAHSRLPLLKARPPDFVVSAQGFNDQVCAPGWPNGARFRCSNANMSRAIAQWLRDVRAATSPATVIVVVVPFGGEMRTQNLTRFAIIAGFDTYQSGATDPHALLVDLYPRSRLGLMGADTSANCTGKFCSGQPPGPTANSCDGTHPLAHRHAHLGAMVAAEVSARVQTGCTRMPLKTDEVLHEVLMHRRHVLKTDDEIQAASTATATDVPQLSSTFYKIYTDNAAFTDDEWRREMRSLRAANLTSLALPYAADADYVLPSPRPVDLAGGACLLGVMSAFYPSALPCMANVSGAPLDGLLAAAKAEGVQVYLGLGQNSDDAWRHMGFHAWRPC